MTEILSFGELAPPADLAAAAFRSALRLEQHDVLPLQVPPDQIAHYNACVAAYEDLGSRFTAAEDRLLQALKAPAGCDSHVAWLTGQRTLADNKEVQVAYEVETHVEAGRMSRRADTPLQVVTHLIHRPNRDLSRYSRHRRFQGVMNDVVIFDADAITSRLDSKSFPRDFRSLEGEARNDLETAGRQEALAPYAEQLLGLNQGIELPEYEFTKELWMRGDEESSCLYGFFRTSTYGRERAILRLLREKPRDHDHAVRLLDDGLKDKLQTTILTLLDCPPENLARDLEHDGPERFEWLAQSMKAMRVAMQKAAYQKVAFGFHSAFMQLLKLEEPKVATMESLARGFQQQTIVGPECYPENPNNT